MNFAPNQKQLAEALGISRQRLAPHLRKPGNPGRRADGRYHVLSWRQYFENTGRDFGQPGPKKLDGQLDLNSVADGVCFGLSMLGDCLLEDVQAVFKEVGLPPDKALPLATGLWLRMLSTVDADMEDRDQPTYTGFEPNPNPEWFPKSEPNNGKHVSP